MFDMSFSEIAVIGVVALVVLGPERLPKVARTAGHLFGRLQRYVATVKADINREMDTSELAKIKQEVQDAAKSFEQTVQQHANSVEKETSSIGQAIEKPSDSSFDEKAPIQTQNAMLANQESGLRDAAPFTESARIGPLSHETASVRATATKDSSQPVQPSLDFGIEPVRMSRLV
jgi:sec-independent protein translocase protein TatB